MTRAEIIRFIQKNPVFFLGTVQENQPHVRGMMVYRADENGIVFITGKGKDVHRQMAANPSVELCFFSAAENKQVRISGSIEVRDEPALKKEIVEKFTFLKPFVEKKGYDVLVPYCLTHGRATVWTMETNFERKTYFDF